LCPGKAVGRKQTVPLNERVLLEKPGLRIIRGCSRDLRQSGEL
jgi:hypothetical protein